MGYRYIGSKEKLSETIIRTFRADCPNAHSVIDLMAGTGLFSKALRKSGYRVVASDVMSYSYHHLVVNLLLNVSPTFEGLKHLFPRNSNDSDGYSETLAVLNNLEPIKDYFFNEFSPEGNPKNGCKPRMYFTAANAQKIDAIRQQIKDWHSDRLITDTEHSLLLHTLILSANDIANIAGTYGHYLSHFVQRATDTIVLHPISFDSDDNIVGHEIYKGYAEDLAPSLCGDICYIDPPYIKRQYAANYHILETLAREDKPEAVGESGLRPWRDQYSNFCSKVKIFGSFGKILSDINCKDFYVSYSSEGLLPIDVMVDFIGRYGLVETQEIEYKRFKSHNDNSPEKVTEYLIHLKKA